MVSVSPLGLLAFGGFVAAILLSLVPIVRASRQPIAPPDIKRL